MFFTVSEWLGELPARLVLSGEYGMLARPLWSQIVDDDALTRGLGDPEARMLVEWLVERVDAWENQGYSEEEVEVRASRLCLWARGVGRFLRLWCHERRPGAALQLAGAQRYHWPLPTGDSRDPCEILCGILRWEQSALALEDERA